MSFDDLAYHGFRPESRYTFCYTCQADVSVPIAQLYSDDDTKRICPQCKQVLPRQQRDDVPTTETGAPDGQQLMQQLFAMNLQNNATGNTNQFIPFPRGMGQDNYADMVAAQQGVDVEALIQSLLQTSSYNAPPTADKFIKTLENRPLTPKDFVQTVIRIRGIDRDLFPTTAEFGQQLIDQHNTDENENHQQEQVHITNVVRAANPIEGQNLKNTADLKYHVVVMKRGKISFVEKARVAQRAGCIALIVIQTDDLWPYTMNDSTKSGHDIVIPCLMLNQKDGEIVISNSERFANVHSVSGGDEKQSVGCEIKIMTRDRTLACPVCRDDFNVNFQAVKLPCDHYYCKDCITPWLEKRSTCPLCRYQLPTEDKKLNERTDPNGMHQLMQQAMFT